MKSADIRQSFLNYFNKQGHKIVPSSSLVPGNDATLLFTNAGMVQFKDVFLGRETRAYQRAVTSQRCVRAGGKHNDLENVGYTARHHTFFEMMGNFSFGDYFKEDAIQLAWQFLTQELGIPAEKLWVTVHHSDKEAEAIWFNNVGIDPSRFSRLDEDNFWSMGDTGPCGPCSEIFYDHGADVWGGPPGSPEEDGDRYIEIWNMVFMQYNRAADGTMTPLPKQSIDTGMGLERLAAVLQGVHSNYEIDLFQNLLNAAADIMGSENTPDNQSLRVIADHIRSVAFLIVDGVQPSNEGRGYVLRRILRRAIRHGNKLGVNSYFFHRLVAPLVAEMGAAYPELTQAQQQVEASILKEETQFAKTLDQGMRILEQDLAKLTGKTIPGDTIFKLYDTFGFPVDLTADIARERDYEMDLDGFDQAMEAQRQRARSAKTFGIDYSQSLTIGGETAFNGYQNLHDKSTVLALLLGDEWRSDTNAQAAEGDHVQLVLASTSFYAESGGQVGDQGYIHWAGGRMYVSDTQKQGSHFVHTGVIESGQITVGIQVTTEVDGNLRQNAAINHSATHLLHEAMRQLLGEHVTQKGSLVAPERLRFDFSHGQPVTASEIAAIEQAVCAQIQANTAVGSAIMSIDDAKKAGAMALFGEKYGDEVRVITMGASMGDSHQNNPFSIELCGGTHVQRTGDIGAFVIVGESGIAAGVRRIEALTGAAATQWLADNGQTLATVTQLVKAKRDNVIDIVQSLLDRNRELEKQLQQLKVKMAASQGTDLLDSAIDIAGVRVLIAHLQGVEPKALRATMDQLRSKLGSSIVVLGVNIDDKASLIAGVSSDLIGRVKAGDIVKHATAAMNGKGGGRPDMAQGGGDAALLGAALDSVKLWLQAAMNG